MKIKIILAIVCMCNTLIGCAQSNATLKMSLQLLQKSPEFLFSMDSTGLFKTKKPSILFIKG